MLYILHGEDEFSRSEAIQKLRQKMDAVLGEMNTAFLEGRGLSLAELQAACDALPFMCACRLVIVSDLVSSTGGKGARREEGDGGGLRGLEDYLSRLPETTRLVLSESRSLPGGHSLLRLAEEQGAYVKQFALPAGSELEQWIRRRAQGKGVAITPEATGLLAAYVGANLRLLEQELEKLATYLGGSGTIGRDEVELLVSSLQEANIFHMVDALGRRDGRRALVLLHRLLEDRSAPLYLLTMIVRQFRLLLQARELDAQGVTAAEMARQMEVPPFVARKCLQQALNFRSADLKAILGQLLEIDVRIKTGQTEGPVALDLFVTRWAAR